MNNKIRGSEKMLFNCDKNGKRSLADFENVEEALQASGGMYESLIDIWEIVGQPGTGLFRDPAEMAQNPVLNIKFR